MYESITSDGNSSGNDKMRVYLYPWSSGERPECSKGGYAADAVSDAADRLLTNGAIDYYHIKRFRAEDYNYVQWEGQTYIEDGEQIEGKFKDYLDDTSDTYGLSNWDVGENGTGKNLYSSSYPGVHLLVHKGISDPDDEHRACIETAGGYAPDGAGGENKIAFEKPVVAWSPACSSEGLTRNAAIQETVHMFVDENLVSIEDEHGLGKVDFDADVTPMMTYHWDDEISGENSVCPSTHDTADGYNQVITTCTIDAVNETGNSV